MQYPIYIHRNGKTGYRGRFPDFPGADASGDTFEELRRNAQTNVQQMYDRSEYLIPKPTNDTAALQAHAMDDGEGIWLFVEIDLGQVISRAVSIQLSLPKSVLQDIATVARKHQMTAAAFINVACQHELQKYAR